MRVLLSGGGTAGHINPAIAIAQYFKAQSNENEILYVGTPNGMEAELVKKVGFDFKGIEMSGFSRGFSIKDISHNIKTVERTLSARRRARAVLKEFKPDIVIGTGGYVSGPILLEATKMKIKTAIHEQNAFPGVTNRILAKKVDMVFLADGAAKDRMPGDFKFEIVGNPVRESIVMKSKTEARKELGLDDGFCILSCGGSLGADTINRLAADLMGWHCREGKINHIHGYGRNGKIKFPKLLRERGIELKKYPRIRANEYIDNMASCLAAADLVIVRAGAMTISEIEATGKAAIFVPSPNVTENHQFFNAMSLVDKGAALILEEKDYSKEKIVKMVSELLDDEAKRKALSQNASSMAILDTAKRIYDTLIKL